MTTANALNSRPDVSRGWLTQYGLAYFGSCIGWAAPSQLLLGNQLLLLRPDDKENALSILMMLGGAAMVLTSLVTGYLSDRTRSRIGRRLPWILAGAAVCAVCLVLMPAAPGFGLLVALWALFQVFMAFVTNNLLTLGPDVAPQRQFGVISGVLGATYTLGLVFGTVVASSLELAPAYMVTAALLLVLVSQLAFGPGLRALLEAERRTPQIGDGGPGDPVSGVGVAAGTDAAAADFGGTDAVFARAEVLPKGAYRDYWWVFASRFVVHIGNYVALFYLLYYLRDHIGIDDPDGGVMILTVIYAACTVLTAIVGGQLSDKLRRRKVFVVFSSIAVAAATVIMAFAHAMPVVIVAAVVLGLAWGVFTSVDQALINEALPSERNRARDVSIMTLTVGITNMISGGVAALALNYLGGYPGLYLLCTVVCLAGTVLVLPVRSSR